MYSRTFFVAMLLVASLAQALTYGLGGWFAVNGTLRAGDVVALALLLTRLYGPLTALSNVRVDVMSALVSFDRVFEVLDLKPSISEKPGAAAVPRGAGRVEFRDVQLPLPGGRRGVAGVAGRRGVAGPHRQRTGAPRRVVHRRAGPDGRARRALRRRQVDHVDAGARGSTT